MSTKQRIPWDEIEGKTILLEMGITAHRVNREGTMLVFNDGTYSVMWARYEDGMLDADESIEVHRGDLVAAGVCTQEEVDAINAREREEAESARRVARLEMYERLKAEFGD